MSVLALIEKKILAAEQAPLYASVRVLSFVEIAYLTTAGRLCLLRRLLN